jgi:hypothetical protein
LAIWTIIGGCLVVVIGLVKNEFFSADIAGGSISDTPVPTWMGRTVFILVGVALIVGGIALSVSKH